MSAYLLGFLPFAGILLSAQAQPDPKIPSAHSEAQILNLGQDRTGRCAEVIRQVRDASGQPSIERGPAVEDDAQLIAAVDKRLDGCPVMQMHGDVSDLRPLPEPSDDFRLRPASE